MIKIMYVMNPSRHRDGWLLAVDEEEVLERHSIKGANELWSFSRQLRDKMQEKHPGKEIMMLC